MSARNSVARSPAFYMYAILLPVFALGACEPPQDDDDFTGDETAEPGMMDDNQMNDTTEFTASLDELQDSGVSGEATLRRPQANGAVMVHVELEDLPREGEYQVSLMQGTCEYLEEDGIFDGDDDQQEQQQQQQQQQGMEQRPGQVASLNAVRGLADLTGTSQTTLDTAEIPMQQDLSIVVYGEQNLPVSCGDVGADQWRDGGGMTGDQGVYDDN